MGTEAKPPFLRRVRIRGYKSIAFCDVALEPLTILVGRNGSGKSNFVDALAFLRDALDDGVNYAFEGHGGLSIFSQALGTNRLWLQVEAGFPSYRAECQATYTVELSLNAQRRLDIEHEALKLHDLTRNVSCGFVAARGQASWEGLESFREGNFQRASPEDPLEIGGPYPSTFTAYRPDRLLLGVLGSQPFIDLAEGLRSMGLFNIHPEAIRQPQPSVGSPALERDGRNLARAIEGLKEIAEEDLARVAGYLSVISPGIEGFEVVPVADRETIRFRLRTTAEGPPMKLYASSMSDGTLRALAALIAAFQIHLPLGPNLVAIEEPETALHPAAMISLVEALDEATLRTQVLITTHSPDLLDAERVIPANVRVVQMIEGRTVIGRVDEASVRIAQKELNTLGGMERFDQLQPDFDDTEQESKAFEALRGAGR